MDTAAGGEPATVQTRSGWLATATSARGSSHRRSGLGNEDAYALRLSESSRCLAVAIADGHGGSQHVRSARGAHLAVAAATELGVDLLAGHEAGRPLGTIDHAEVSDRLVTAWIHAVDADLASTPLADEEVELGGAALLADGRLAYGTTVLLALVTDDVALLGQLGDGDILVVPHVGSVVAPIPADDRNVGGATTSLCLPGARDDVRYAVVATEGVDVLVLGTDGYGNSFADPAWREQVGLDLRASVLRDEAEAVSSALPGWVAESALVGGDDATVALVVRVPPAPVERDR